MGLLVLSRPPRDRFNRKPEIVRDIATRHRKDHHFRLLKAAVHFLQERGTSFITLVFG